MKNYTLMLFTGLLLCLSHGAYSQPNPGDNIPPQNKPGNKKISYRLLKLPDNTWGYDILVDSKPFIHQIVIPGAATMQGFKTDAAAERVAKLVTKKMKAGEMPPTVTMDELKKLKAL